MDSRMILQKAYNIVDESIKIFSVGSNIVPFKYSASFHAIFYTNGGFEKIFVEIIPENELDDFMYLIKFLTQINSTMNDVVGSYGGQQYKITTIKNGLERLKEYLKLSLKNNEELYNIFYSWQSDLLNSGNRNFIENAINSAIRQLNQEYEVTFKLDQDTRDVSGSPDIIRAILEKIDNCFMFIGDVSIVHRGKEKAIPNPNVMFELGYAIKSISDKNVIMVFNEQYGSTSELPFDLGLKRQIKYNCNEDITPENKKEEKSKLAKDIYNAIKTAYNVILQ